MNNFSLGHLEANTSKTPQPIVHSSENTIVSEMLHHTIGNVPYFQS